MDEIITLTFVIEREDDRYVATCRELDVASQGRSIEDAVQHLQDAVALYIEVIEEDGERERVFRERGIQIQNRLPTNYQVAMPAGVFATIQPMPLRRLTPA